MKRILWVMGVLLVVLAGGVLVGPGLVDWNQYKDDIQAQAKKATGRDLVINGNIKITVLPAPALIAGDVSLANIEGASSPHMMRLKSLEIRVALAPLLTGRIEVERVKLVDPVVELEVLADGSRNWVFDTGGGTTQAVPPAAGTGEPVAATSAPPITLDNFTIENGTLIYRDAKNGTVERIEAINANFAAASLAGPFESTGGLRLRGVPLTYSVNVGEIIHGRTVPFNLKLGVAPGNAHLQMSGTVVGLGEVPKVKGKIKGGGDTLAGLIGAVLPGAALPGLLSQDFVFDGAVTVAAAGAEIKGLSFRLGKTQTTADITIDAGKILTVAGRVAANRIDLDRWLELSATPTGGKAQPAAGTPEVSSSGTSASKPGAGGSGATAFSIPKNINGSLNFTAEAITYRNGVIRKAILNAELTHGEITISQLSGKFPGGSDMAVFGFVTAAEGQPRFEGELETTVNDLHGVLGWLGLEIKGVAPDRLRKLTLVSRVVVDPEQVQFSGLDLQFDSSRLTGGVTVAITKRPSFGAEFLLDRLNLDAYLPKPPEKTAQTGKKKATKAVGEPGAGAAAKAGTEPRAKAPLPALKMLTTLDANLKARIKTLVFEGRQIKDVFFDGTLHNGRLKIRRLSVAKMAGASGSVSGIIDGLAGEPTATGLKFDVRASDVPRFLRLAGLDPPVPAKDLGAVRVRGQLDGKLLSPRLSLKLDGAGASVSIDGQIEGLATLPTAKALKFRLVTKDASRLLRLAGVDAPAVGKNLGPLSASGVLDGNLLTPKVTLNLKAAGGDVFLDGTLNLMGAGDMLDMTLKASHPNAARLLRVLGAGYRPVGKIGGLDVQARLKLGPAALTLQGMTAKIGTIELKGDVALALGGPRPKITATLNAGPITIDPFLPARKTASLGDGPKGRPWGGARVLPAAWTGMRHLAAGEKGRLLTLAAVGEWSRDPIDLSGLGAFDAEVALKSPTIEFDRYRLDNADLAFTLAAGKLKVSKVTGQLFGGALHATATVTATARPRFETVFALENVNLSLATRALAGEPLATGRMSIQAKLQTAGRSLAEMISGLSGGGSLRMSGVDVKGSATGTAMAGALGLVSAINQFAGLLGGAKKSSGADISGNFRINRGVARSQDLKLTTHVGKGTAAGSIDLPRWRIDVKGQVQLEANFLTALLQSRSRTNVTQAVPFTIRGRLDKPTVNLDTSKLPGGGLPIPGIDKLIKKAPKGIGGILQGILGGGVPRQGTGTTGGTAETLPPPPGSEPPPPPSQPPSQPRQITPQDLLKELFRRR